MKLQDDPSNINPALPRSLKRLYRQVPKVNCKGLCWESCSAAPARKVEVEQMKRLCGSKAQSHPSPLEALLIPACPFLNEENRCAGYSARPLICRMFGAVRKMKCPHGCKPTSGFMSDQREKAVLMDYIELDPDFVVLGWDTLEQADDKETE